MQIAFTRRVGLDGLNDLGDRLVWSKAEQAAEMIWIGLAFQQMIFVPLANLVDYGQQEIRVGFHGEYWQAAMRSEAEVIMELVGPRYFVESGEEHE